MTLFAWPKKAAFGRVVPKRKIYEHVAVGSTLKERFVQQVEQINWAYKLAPETVNLPATSAVTEIQVFRISLKGAGLDQDVLKAIDRAIPFPLIFELGFEQLVQVAACHKRPSESDANKSVTSDYFTTAWMSTDTPCSPMPIALDLAALYEQLLHQLIPLASRSGEGLSALVERVAQMRSKQREVDQTQARLSREKQFNRKVEINTQLRRLKTELEEISR